MPSRPPGAMGPPAATQGLLWGEIIKNSHFFAKTLTFSVYEKSESFDEKVRVFQIIRKIIELGSFASNFKSHSESTDA